LTLVIVVILMYSIILHEVSHGLAALWNGDPTARAMKRLTLNPLPHIDPLGTVILPILLILTHAPFFIGWAKPVPYNPRYFKDEKKGIFTVALAGPLTNFILAAFFGIALKLTSGDPNLSTAYFYGLSLNIMLAIFNLIPIPPLDGSKILSVFLPVPLRESYLSLERVGFLLILVLMYGGLLTIFLLPLYRAVLNLFLL
jgi:Zn-dependent protease